MLGEIFKKARQEIQTPATLKRLIVDLIDPEDWMSMRADVKGDIYEGLLAKSAQESLKGAGQYFTPRDSSRPWWTACGRGRTTPFAIPPAERADSCWPPTTMWSASTGARSTPTRMPTCGRTSYAAGRSCPRPPGAAS